MPALGQKRSGYDSCVRAESLVRLNSYHRMLICVCWFVMFILSLNCVCLLVLVVDVYSCSDFKYEFVDICVDVI